MQTPYPLSYSKWLKGLLPEPLQAPILDCQACVMTDVSLERPFAKNLKCCTYQPFIPNFSLGKLLETQGKAFELRLQVAAEKGSLNPLGLFPASGERLNYDARDFGRNENLKCSFLDPVSVSCSIWNERPGVCASYFCPPGDFAQRKDLENFLNVFEWTMAHEALLRLGLTSDDTKRLHSGASVWFEWHKREMDFFRACARVVEEICQADVKELLARELGALEKSVTLAVQDGSC